MNATTRELLRNSLLLQLTAGGERGLKIETLKLGAKLASFRLREDPDDVADELAYLRDKGLVAEVNMLVSPELRRQRITAAGRDYLASEGLI